MAIDGRDGTDTVVLVAGVRLVAPTRPGDCTCVFCSTFRTRHLVARAVVMTVVALAAVVIAALAALQLRDSQGGAAGMVGAMFIFATGLVVLAGVTWYQPLRRWLHMRRPRSTAWPPH
jgi:hypothetical protein